MALVKLWWWSVNTIGPRIEVVIVRKRECTPFINVSNGG